MVYSNTTDNNGLIQDLEIKLFSADFGAISNNTARMQIFTNYLNRALDQITHVLLSNDNTWKWDDYNNTDFPEAKTNLISGQGDYTLAVTHLTIQEVTCFNSAGDEYKLEPIVDELSSSPLSERFETDGQPRYYKLEGNSILLYPAPDYNYSEGLIIKTQRPHTYFTTSDTTKTPGFASHFHHLVSLIAARDYSVDFQAENVEKYEGKTELEMKNLADHIAKRHSGRINKVIPKYKLKI